MNRKKFLHTIFKEKGAKAKHYTRQCIGMIPEIYRLKIYEEEGFGSIYEYAAKLAGIGRLQVDTVLRLERKFEDKPALKAALVSGEISHHKLLRVASISTAENQEELAAKAKILPRRALDTFVKDEKFLSACADENGQNGNLLSACAGENAFCFLNQNHATHANQKNGNHYCHDGAQNENPDGQSAVQNKNPDGSGKPLNSLKCLSGQTFEEGLRLDEKVKEKLLDLQKKGLDVNEILLELLEKREKEIEEEKEALGACYPARAGADSDAKRVLAMRGIKTNRANSYIESDTTNSNITLGSANCDAKPARANNDTAPAHPSRYIPVKIKRNLQKEYGTKCSIPHCTRPAAVIHHTNRFALAQNHDPHYLAPLCREHHMIAHSIDAKMFKKRRAA